MLIKKQYPVLTVTSKWCIIYLNKLKVMCIFNIPINGIQWKTLGAGVMHLLMKGYDNMIKKVMASVMAVTMVFGCAALPAGVLSEQSVISASAATFGDFTYTLNKNGTVEITKYNGSDTVVEVPSEIDGHKVTKLGDDIFCFKKVTDVTIPEGVTTLGNSAFSQCITLESVTLPDSLTSIGREAFNYCWSLKSLTIPDGVTSIGEATFERCSELKSINIPGSVKSIGKSAFERCSELKSITIPGSVNSIGKSAFLNCSALESAEIQNGVASIGESAFLNCSSLETISIPESVTTISEYAFEKTAWIDNMRKADPLIVVNSILIDGKAVSGTANIPDGVTTIAPRAFSGADSLEAVNIPDSVTSIGNFAFYNCTQLGSVDLPDGLTSIGRNAFYNCAKLGSVDIPDGLTSIGYAIFCKCSSLRSVIIPKNVKTIGEFAFQDCSLLSSVEFSEGLTTIDRLAFSNCNSLKSVTVPKSVTTIGEKALGYVGGSKSADFKIYCYKDTAGERYARGFAREVLDELPKLTYKKGNNSVTLSWNKISRAEKYGIAGWVDNKWQLLAQCDDTSYVLGNLNDGQDYRVAVVIKVNGKWETDFSNEITVTPKTAEEKQYPAVLKSVKDNKIGLKWNKVQGAEKYGIAVYQANQWKVVKQVNGNVTTWTSPKVNSGDYRMVVLAKVNGQWVNADMGNHAFYVWVD